jgi:hypothetical protein
VEAHPGDVIDQIAQAALNSVKYQPNVVLINAGNNDCHQNLNISFAGYRMGKLLDELYDKIPGVTIVLSTLILSTNSDVEKNRGSVNNQIRTLVADRLKSKNKIILAEMVGDGSGFVQQADLTNDGIHPNEDGAKKMGHIFYQAIVKANDNGMLIKAIKTDFSPVENANVQSSFSNHPASSTNLPPTTAPTPTTSAAPNSVAAPNTVASPSPATSATPASSFGAVLQTKQASATASPSASVIGNTTMLTSVSPTPASPTDSPQASSTNILSSGQGVHTSAARSVSYGGSRFLGLATSLIPFLLCHLLL